MKRFSWRRAVTLTATLAITFTVLSSPVQATICDPGPAGSAVNKWKAERTIGGDNLDVVRATVRLNGGNGFRVEGGGDPLVSLFYIEIKDDDTPAFARAGYLARRQFGEPTKYYKYFLLKGADGNIDITTSSIEDSLAGMDGAELKITRSVPFPGTVTYTLYVGTTGFYHDYSPLGDPNGFDAWTYRTVFHTNNSGSQFFGSDADRLEMEQVQFSREGEPFLSQGALSTSWLDGPSGWAHATAPGGATVDVYAWDDRCSP